MTTTARISATTGEGTYTNTVADGASVHFKTVGLGIGEEVVVKARNSSATYDILTYLDEQGRARVASMTFEHNSIRLQGPLDFQLFKRPTAVAAEVVQYT